MVEGNERWQRGDLSKLRTLAISVLAPIVFALQMLGQGPTPAVQRDHNPSRFPMAEFIAAETTDLSRKEKNSRYERYAPFTINDPNPGSGGQLIDDHLDRPDAIPADADLVMIGQVLSGSAHLTDGKRNIYSEFVIRVDEVIKQDKVKDIVVAENIVADRLGGRIRFKNGAEVTYRAAGFDMPAIGKQHVFFLARDNKSPNDKLITAYEIEGEIVQPIDRIDSTKIPKEKRLFLIEVKRLKNPVQ